MADGAPLRVMGCPCLAFAGVEESHAYLEELLEDSSQSHYSVAINAEKILRYRDDPEFRKLVDASRLPVPDGSGAVLALRWLHQARSIKLDLPRAALHVADHKRLPIFVLGAKDEVNAAACERIVSLYPGIRIVGRRNGYFQDEGEVIDEIAGCSPRVTLVAMGSPRQEFFACRAAQRTRGILFVGAGGALDILSGRLKRAPSFMVDNHLEWLYRLLREPRRIRRQKRLPAFFAALCATRFGLGPRT